MSKKRKASLGSVSTATLRLQDLIPCFLDVLRTLDPKHELLAEIERHMTCKNYYASELSDDDLEALFDTLNEFAPDDAYFGAHPGDGADFGFWKNH